MAFKSIWYVVPLVLHRSHNLIPPFSQPGPKHSLSCSLFQRGQDTRLSRARHAPLAKESKGASDNPLCPSNVQIRHRRYDASASSSSLVSPNTQNVTVANVNAKGNLVRENCSLRQVNGSAWAYPNQTGTSFLPDCS